MIKELVPPDVRLLYMMCVVLISSPGLVFLVGLN